MKTEDSGEAARRLPPSCPRCVEREMNRIRNERLAWRDPFGVLPPTEADVLKRQGVTIKDAIQ